MVFVINKNKQPLSPCHSAVARKLLKQGKAVIHKRFPFTIRLKELKNSETKAECRLKIDYGSRHTGLAILSGTNVMWVAQLHHKTNIVDDLKSRSALRKSRRNRKTRYRQARWLHRVHSDDWLQPSLKSKVNNIVNMVVKLRKLCPLTHISYENVKFDTQLMQNPEISGVEYQQGTLKGYEVREYLLEKFDRKCAYCKAENVPLQIEHIISKAKGGTNRISNLTIACQPCNQAKGTMSAEEFGHPEVQKQAKASLKDVASLNITRWKVYEALLKTGLPVDCGTGGRTKFNRTNLELPKDHHFDAICVGVSTPENIVFQTNQVLHIKAKGRGSHCRTNVNKYGFPVGYLARQKRFFGFQTGDVVKAIVPKGKYQGTWVGAVACRKSGSFDIKDRHGKRTAQSVNYKNCKKMSRNDGYEYVSEILDTTFISSIK